MDSNEAQRRKKVRRRSLSKLLDFVFIATMNGSWILSADYLWANVTYLHRYGILFLVVLLAFAMQLARYVWNYGNYQRQYYKGVDEGRIVDTTFIDQFRLIRWYRARRNNK